MARVPLPESKLKARKRRRRFAAATLFAFLAVVLAGAVVGLFYLPHLRVVGVEVAGAEGAQAEALKRAVQEELAGRYFLVFPRNNVLIYPRKEIVESLLQEFPMFASATVRAHTPRALRVEVAPRSPHALWCGEARAQSSACFLIDEKGVVYEPSAELPGLVYTRYFGRTNGGALPRQYIEEEQFRMLAALVAALEQQQGVRVASVEVDDVLDVRARFANGFELIFALQDGGGDIFERFVLALESEPFKNNPVSAFEYLDLRFGDRLYYKLKGE